MARLEVHEHSYISGRYANGGANIPGKMPPTWKASKFSHSHEGGDRPHQHPETGPASYTIDKDDWLRTTGLRGGGRKTFTVKPTGEQLPIVELEDWQKFFELIIGDPPADYRGEGPGFAPAARMILGHKMTCVIRDARTPGKSRPQPSARRRRRRR
ncbi:MAG TPA: hypothetical protein VE620_03350 [Myxococcales bacterium]|jgi:hypothetical protein|nr:hypothetical protein [Myxococcales bacterium]